MGVVYAVLRYFFTPPPPPYIFWRRWVYDGMMESIEDRPPFSYLAFQIFCIGMMWLLVLGPITRFVRGI
ncbi:MAG: hypothetical protein LBT81_04205 [Helicobacteraceae bacterium]|nr:hypothetical protein [Helicobacteraceae bacterium]